MCLIGSILRAVIPLKKKYGKDNLRAIKIRELVPHLETLVEHINTYEANQNNTNCLLNCQDKEHLPKVRIMKLELLKTLQRYYTAQSIPDKIYSTVEQITLIKVAHC